MDNSLRVKCVGCKRDKRQNKFGKFENGNYKKTCLLCSFKRKGVKNIREKQKMNWYKVHKELRRKFKPQRIKEYYQNNKHKF